MEPAISTKPSSYPAALSTAALACGSHTSSLPVFPLDALALLATVLVAAAGNVIYYMTAEPSMSHNVSLFLSASFFLTWARYRDDNRLRIAALYGVIGGAMALVRPQDGLFLLLPYLAQIPTAWRRLRVGDFAALGRMLGNGLASGAVALAVFRAAVHRLERHVWPTFPQPL